MNNIKRSAGILMPISSLPSNYGIGTFGKKAYEFVDFLVKAKQSYWQILPIGPTSEGDSPYSSFSSYAGNPYFIDLDVLVEEGYLKNEDVSWLKNDKYVDYGYLYQTRYDVLKIAYKNGFEKDEKEFEKFAKENANWLADYSLYMAVKKHFQMCSWLKWPDEEIKSHKEAAIEKYTKELKEDILFYQYLQFLFFKQYLKLKKYANDNGIKIIGDLPIYVAMDSSDAWANADCFQLDQENVPFGVAGVPPDYFSEDGQLWGNPLYDWDKLKKQNYKFWIDRVGGVSKVFDVVRIDHFRAFASYWSVPADSSTAKTGHWEKGPGMDLIGMLTSWFSNVQFIAEDLGLFGEDVVELLRDSGLPGMKILEFGFSHESLSDHCPSAYPSKNYICYTGTHDNSTLMGWLNSADKKDVNYALKYLNIKNKENFASAMIREGMKSIACLFIGQMQDYLNLDDCARMNTPSTVGLNWKWRADEEDINEKLAKRIADLTTLYYRD